MGQQRDSESFASYSPGHCAGTRNWKTRWSPRHTPRRPILVATLFLLRAATGRRCLSRLRVVSRYNRAGNVRCRATGPQDRAGGPKLSVKDHGVLVVAGVFIDDGRHLLEDARNDLILGLPVLGLCVFGRVLKGETFVLYRFHELGSLIVGQF